MSDNPNAGAPGADLLRESGPGQAGAPALEHSLQQLGAQLLRERRSDRRWRIFFRLAWLLFALAVAALLLAPRLYGAGASGPHTALVELRGELDADGEASAERLLEGLRAAFESDLAQAVVLRINSPGGSPVQAGIVNDEIRRLKALHKKKVYAVVEEICASGAYYVAVAADAIYVDKASLIGSIGVLIDGFGFDRLMAKAGVDRRLLTAGENKGMLDPFSPPNKRQQAYAQAMIERIHQQFIRAVRNGRGDRLKDAPGIFSGLVWNGDDAVKLGLADQLGSLDYVAREVVKAEDIIDYTSRENVAERLARRFGAAVGEGAMHAVSAAVRLR